MKNLLEYTGLRLELQKNNLKYIYEKEEKKYDKEQVRA